MKFWLGTHKAHWLRLVDIPLMVSARTLAVRAAYPRARAPWVLDSGGFTELSLYGEWRMSSNAYVAAVTRYGDEIGRLEWAAPQDWMCEPAILARTGRTVAEHQRLTIENYLELEGRGPFVPVLQGFDRADYLRHVDAYDRAGVDLTRRELVGVGTLCRRQGERQILEVVDELVELGLRVHGFGVKRKALNSSAARLFTSADSLAWSYRARRSAPLPGCPHKACSNCVRYALEWRAETLARLDDLRPYQRTFAV